MSEGNEIKVKKVKPVLAEETKNYMNWLMGSGDLKYKKFQVRAIQLAVRKEVLILEKAKFKERMKNI